MRRVRKALAAALVLLEQEDAELSILFVGRERMKHLNTLYRGISKETDVLSFPMADARPSAPHASFRTPHILGDIVISIPKTLVQAKTYGAPFYKELLRLLIHGLLHLLGYDHEKSRYRKMKMETKEKEILHAISHMA